MCLRAGCVLSAGSWPARIWLVSVQCRIVLSLVATHSPDLTLPAHWEYWRYAHNYQHVRVLKAPSATLELMDKRDGLSIMYYCLNSIQTGLNSEFIFSATKLRANLIRSEDHFEYRSFLSTDEGWSVSLPQVGQVEVLVPTSAKHLKQYQLQQLVLICMFWKKYAY